MNISILSSKSPFHMKKSAHIDIQKKFRTIFDEGPLGMATIDLDFTFLDINNKFCEMVGYSSEELKEHTFTDITHPDDAELDISLARQLYRGEIPSYNMRKRYLRQNKEIFWVSLTATLIRDEDGEPLYYLAMVEDINEAVHIQEKLLERETELTKINDDKDRLFSIIAHDLRSPFTTLQGFTEILIEDINELSRDEMTQYLNAIYSSSKNLMNLLDNLLNWSRLNTGNIAFYPEPVHLNELIKENMKVFTYTGKSKNINISMDLNGTGTVMCDRNMMSTVVRNFLSNALKFTPTNGTISIYSNIKTDQFIFIVKDSGTGMPPGRVKELMSEKLVQSFRGTDNEIGTGLGLKLVKEFIKMHKGDFNVESEPGKGSTFTITIPIEQK